MIGWMVPLPSCRGLEAQRDDEAQSIELHVPEMPLLDPNANEAPALAMGRTSVEVARAAECAITVLDLVALETPIGARHGNLPPDRWMMDRYASVGSAGRNFQFCYSGTALCTSTGSPAAFHSG